MNTLRESIRRRPRRFAAGFTMVEIAICIGILGFALVAIIGVLPTGLKVQKENRDETIITQDGVYWIEAIRSGSKAVDDLTNYVDVISVTNVTFGSGGFVYRPGDALPQGVTAGGAIIGRLSTPYLLLSGAVGTNNYVVRGAVAEVRSISGNAIDKDPLNRDFAFRYQLISEVIPLDVLPPETRQFQNTAFSQPVRGQLYTNYLISTNIAANFYEIKLTLRWPLIRRGAAWEPGNNSKVFRTTVSGRLNYDAARGLYYFEPSSYAQAGPIPAPP